MTAKREDACRGVSGRLGQYAASGGKLQLLRPVDGGHEAVHPNIGNQKERSEVKVHRLFMADVWRLVEEVPHL